jgi:hypothetical protein
MRTPLFWFFAGMVVAFSFIRMSVRLIRAQVRWWFRNVTTAGLHVHHVVFGVVLMLVGGVAGLVIPVNLIGWRCVAAAVVGIGAGLVLDEFALILHLRDVYWAEQGRTSIDAVFLAVAVTGLMLLGLRPFFVTDILDNLNDPGEPDPWVWSAVFLAVNLGLAVITLLKGKIWTGILGLFIPLLLIVGAIRLARPGSPWAHWRYRQPRRRGARKLARARRRERRLREPVVRAKIWFQELIAGTHR